MSEMLDRATPLPAAEPAPLGPDALAPLGPDSLTWRRFGDLRISLLMTWAGTLQAMHPVISTALLEHSDVFENPVARLLRSGGPIVDVVYAGPSAGARVRGYHRGIEGVDERGERYHALHPEPYYWAHATFLAMQYVVAEYFAEPLSDADKERLYQESIRWYAQYGLSMRAVPPDYAAFLRYWEHTVADVLLESGAIRRSALHGAGPVPPPAPWIPPALWRLLGMPLVGLEMWLARGLLPAAARARLGWRWSAREEWGLRLFGRVVRTAFRLVPPAYRLAPTPRRAFRAAGVRP
jgi:uncharacterized protein (DUF2236 family)